MQPNKNQKFKITTLSPVHIGSGNKILGNFEFYFDRRNRKTIIYDMDEIFEKIANNRRAIDELSEMRGDRNDNIASFIQKHRINLHNSHSYSVETHSREILEFIYDGMGKPMIPGSSLKGSIKSAIFNFLFSQLSEKEQKSAIETGKFARRDMFAGNDLEKRIFGKDPLSNIMKAFSVGDSFFDDKNINLGTCQVMSLTRDNSWYWKKGFRDFPMAMVFQYLRENSNAETTLGFNEFYINDPKAVRELKFNDKMISDFTVLNSIINDFSRKLIESELAFFYAHDTDDKLGKITDFYEILKRQVPNNSIGCILRLGWGSGWTSMTGNYLNDFEDVLGQYRRNFGIGKILCPKGHEIKGEPKFDFTTHQKTFYCKNCRMKYSISDVELSEVFPKSRKIFMNRRNPETVMGWIKMEII